MNIPRRARKAPTREPDPLDDYSTWDLRIAKTIYYSIILASVVTILGIWLTIIGWLIETGRWETLIAETNIGIGTLIIVGIVVLHLFLLVLFYTLFRGGILKLCRRLFKDRILAKKYEDYSTLRLLLAVTLISVYIFVITLLFIIMPQFFWTAIAGFLGYWIPQLNPGEWVLVIGIMMFFIILLVYIGFVLWNKSVFAVLKRVKRIEEEEEIEEEIKREELKSMDEDTLQRVYEKSTGKKALYRGKETKAYISWKKRMLS